MGGGGGRRRRRAHRTQPVRSFVRSIKSDACAKSPYRYIYPRAAAYFAIVYIYQRRRNFADSCAPARRCVGVCSYLPRSSTTHTTWIDDAPMARTSRASAPKPGRRARLASPPHRPAGRPLRNNRVFTYIYSR